MPFDPSTAMPDMPAAPSVDGFDPSTATLDENGSLNDNAQPDLGASGNSSDNPTASLRPVDMGANPSWGGVASSAAKNFIPSVLGTAEGMISPILHPVRTAGSILDAAAGEAQKILPQPVVNAINDLDWNKQASERARQSADALNSYFANRYGSMEGFKNAIATDPAGVITDMAAVLGGGGELAAKLPGIAGKAGDLALDASRTFNPAGNLIANATDAAFASRPAAMAGNAIASLGRAGSNVIRTLNGTELAPEEADALARDYINRLMQNSSKTPADLANYITDIFQKPATAAEAIGRSGINALGALARRQGTTADALAGQLEDRASLMPSRMLADYASASGINPAAAQGDIDTVVSQGQAAAKPLYDAAYSRGVVRTKPFSALMQAPAMQSAIQRATQIFGNEYAADNARNAVGAATPEQWQKFVTGVPDKTAFPTKFLDYVKRGLDSQIESYRDPVTGKLNLRDPLVRSAQDIRQQFVQQAKKMNPAYGQALDTAGDYLSASQAFSNGQKFILQPSVTAKQFQSHLDNLSDAEAEAFKGGVANALFNQAMNGRLSPNFFNRPIVKQKLGAVLGDKADDFLDQMKVESDLAKSGARMAPGVGSVTSDVLNATDEQNVQARDAALSLGLAGLHGASGNAYAAARHLLSAGKSLGAFGRTGTMPVEVRNAAGELLMQSPEKLADYLNSAPSAHIPNTPPHLPSSTPQALLGSYIAGAPQRGESPSDEELESATGELGAIAHGFSDGGHVHTAAHEAETEPSEAQIKAGNYRKGHVRLHGFDISIETRKGAARRGIGKDGMPWENVHGSAHYGYIRRTVGADSENVDAYIGPHPSSRRIFIVNQIEPGERRFDEHKIIFGARTLKEAKAIYDDGFSDKSGPKRRWSIYEVSPTELRDWLDRGPRKKPFSPKKLELVA